MPEHLDRVLEEMRRRDVDVLLLGREGNARYVSGARRLWLAGTRPFAPGCAVVRETGAVHLLSITDHGVPASIPPERLYPISWNPLNLVSAVVAAPGVARARRVGVDGMTPLFERLLAAVLPGAELVDGEALMRDVRRVKSAADLEAIGYAVAVAEDSLAAAVAALWPGITEAELRGTCLEQMAAHGVTTPAFDPEFSIEGGDLVAMRLGVLAAGWEASLARTWPSRDARPEHRASWSRWWAAWNGRLVDRCAPGTRVGDLRLTEGAVVDGLGMGHEVLADSDVLEPGMVVALQLRHAGMLGAEMLHLTRDGNELLTRAPYPALG